MNEPQSTSADLQILSKIKQVPSTFGAHSTWEEEDSGTHRWGREPHDESASGHPSERVGATSGLWSPFRWHQPLPHFLCQQSRPLELPCGFPFTPLRAAEGSSVVRVTLWIHARISTAQLKPQGPLHTIWPISTLPLFSCVYLPQHLWIWLFFCSAAVWLGFFLASLLSTTGHQWFLKWQADAHLFGAINIFSHRGAELPPKA